MSNITIIDAPCGAGKTTFAIEQINRNINTPYVYCTPYLDEVNRIMNACRRRNGSPRFWQPSYKDGAKIDSFNALLADGVDIAVTHTTFLNSTFETLDFIRRGNYTLFLDEVIEPIIEFNKAQSVAKFDNRQTITKGDIDFLLQSKLIELDEKNNNMVRWIGCDRNIEHKFSKVREYAKLGRLHCVHESMMMLVFPPEIFSCFNDVYMLTYMHEGTDFPKYLSYYNIPYKLATIRHDEAKHCYLSEYSSTADYEFRESCQPLIHVHNNKRMNKYPKADLSKTWFEKQAKQNRQAINGNTKTMGQLKNNLSNYFTQIRKAKANDIMWTAPKDYMGMLKGKGYNRTRPLTAEEKKLDDEQRDKLENEISCFVAQNARATNNYSDRHVLAYCVNKYYNVFVSGFFEKSNIKLDQDKYALACMIQWIFRSAIRNGEEIWIYIPSERMRKLLEEWLNPDSDSDNDDIKHIQRPINKNGRPISGHKKN